ncbi:MAG: hypothetical protein KC613_09710, partial [Myxococcales bacterium]|nr:hypothetical protein [Myxococcales bacterium]
MRGGILGLLLLALTACKGGKTPPAPPASPAPLSPPSVAPPSAPPRAAAPASAPDWPAMQASDDNCADCHPDEAEAWARSPMGRSFKPIEAASHDPFKVPAALVHPVTGLGYRQTGGRFSEVAGAQAFRQPAAVVIGSGSHAHSYLWQQGARLFELPLTWYETRRAWDLSPGYDRGGHPGSFRAVTDGCVACHADPVQPEPGTRSFFATAPHRGMGCARCHGDGRAHSRAHLDGGQAPITSPKALPTGLANDVCGLCHFPGAARILRDGQTSRDFVAGQPLADHAAVFVREVPPDGFGSISHTYRLQMSACFKQTPGGLKCVGCHSPHPTGPVGDRSKPCRDCHGPQGHAAQHACAGPADEDCVRCHMDKGQTQNIPHVSATDHFIRTKPQTRPPKNNDSPLLWAADPQPHPRDADHQVLLGRAYVEAFRADGQPRDAERAEAWLSKGLAALPGRVDGWIELATLRRLRGDR